MLVHICCSVDSHYFLQKIKQDYPDENIVGFFYNPNIHPYSEYRLRLFDVKYSCDILGIKLIEASYDFEAWLKAIKGLENEPEKGNRCTVCFDKRLLVSAKKALELNKKRFTTTLLMSPRKSQEKLQLIGKDLEQKLEIEFVFKDYRKNNGIKLQSDEVQKYFIYRQNYCGCLFGLTQQMKQQNKFLVQMISPINQQILPQSIEEKLQIYKKRNKFYKNNKKFKIIKTKFLNYRILNGYVKINNQTIPSYFLPYSTTRHQDTTTKILYNIDNISYCKDEIKIIDLTTFNILAKSQYKTIQELYYHPLKFAKELKIRKKIINLEYDLSCIIVLDKIPTTKINIYLNSITYKEERLFLSISNKLNSN
jgi:predicted adenine nucleotide alpha hydrolase (AANH) superfamily ATPase